LEDTVTDTAITTDMLAEAAGMVITSQFGSQSMLQRKMRLNFHTAGLVMDRLETAGVVGPRRDDGQARDVLMLPDRYAEAVAALHGRDSGGWRTPVTTDYTAMTVVIERPGTYVLGVRVRDGWAQAELSPPINPA
jgi:hypothetical protein